MGCGCAGLFEKVRPFGGSGQRAGIVAAPDAVTDAGDGAVGEVA